MKVQNIQPAAFGKKQRFISKEMYGTIRSLLTDMNKETATNSNGFVFLSTRTKSLKYKDTAELIDCRMFFQRMPEDKQMQKNTVLLLGEKIKLVIDNISGEITNHSKPPFKSWNSVMKSVNDSLNMLKENFNNKDVVKKEYEIYSDLTRKGREVLLPNTKKSFSVII